MLNRNGKKIIDINHGRLSIRAVYRGSRLIWQKETNSSDARSCYGNGYWLNSEPWYNDDAWIN